MDLATLSTLAEQLAPLVLQKIKGKGKKEVSELTTVNDYENVKSLPAWYWNKQTGEKKAVNVSMADFQQHVKDVANQNLVEIKQEAEEANAAAQNSAESAAASAASAKASEDAALAQKNETVDYLNTVKANENERITNENERKTNEETRKSNEITRANQENTRITNEEERISNEASRVEAEGVRVSAENTRVDNELVRETDEQIRQSAERDRSGNEDVRLDNEAIRKQNESERQEAESLRDTAESERANSEVERDLAEQARIEAENTRIANEEERTTWFTNIKTSVSDWFTSAQSSWTTWFDNVKSLWGTLKSDVENATTLAVEATENANNSANHPPYVGEDLYWYVWNNETKTYDKTDKYSKGDGFSIKMTFASISEMEAYDNSSVILELGDFVLISSDVEDEDNSKLFVVTSVTSSKITFGFLTDMSGARGFTGHTPQLSVGTITTGAAGTLANVSLSENGTDTDGNPKYLINFVIPKGEKGDKGDAFTYNDFTEEQIAGLQKPAKDAAAVALSAADNANNKATLANNAATNANEKAELANTAATDANNAAARANSVITDAETAANNANQAATNANNAASSANSAADNANNAVANLNWDNLKDKPSTFTPSAHNHTISEITDIGNASVNYATSAGDADTIDGNHASAFATAGHNHFDRLNGVNIDTGLSHTLNRHYEIVYATGTLPFSSEWHQVYVMGSIDSDYTTQICTGLDENTSLYFRHRIAGTWNYWRTILDSENYSSYALPLSGGTLTGALTISAGITSTSVFVDTGDATLKVYSGKTTDAANDGNICLQTSFDRSNGETHSYPIDYSSRCNLVLQPRGGQVYIGLNPLYADPDNKLYVNGRIYSTSLLVTGTITYGSLAQSSDVRKKNIINDTMLLIDDIANAPLFTYTYKDNEQDKRIHSGTSAQYWEGVNSGLFTTIMQDGSYGLMSSELSLCAAISIAKQFRDYKEKTDAKIEDLQNEVKELKELVNSLIK